MLGRRWLWTTVILLLGVLLTGCASMKVGSHRDNDISFSDYATYSWIADDPFIFGEDDVIPISPLLRKKIVDQIDETLLSKGYEYTSNRDAADFVLSYTVGTREKIDANSYPPSYSGAWGWHFYGRYYIDTQTTHRTYTEGTLGIDIFDGASKQPTWHGWASKSIYSSDRENPDPLIERAVTQILDQFPSRSN